MIKRLCRISYGYLAMVRKIICSSESSTRLLAYINAFLDSHEPILADDGLRTRMLHTFAAMIDETQIEGDYAELGVYRGKSARIIACHGEGRSFYLFDTFEGFCPEQLQKDELETYGNFTKTTPEYVAKFVQQEKKNVNVVVKEGLFSETKRGLENHRFALVHLDCDLSEPMKEGLEFFYPRTSPGGVIIIHDYISEKYPRVRQVVDGFFSDKPETVYRIKNARAHAAVIVKPR